jgi:PIN domain nuclease of toxin-antitoxin system
VNLLLDTHTLRWFLRDDPNLSSAAAALIVDPANHKYVSVASFWEIAIKSTRNKLGLTEPSGALLAREHPRNGFDLLAIQLSHVARVELLPEHHKDPFDRLLASQALVEGIPLVSVDSQFDSYGVTRLW